MRTQQQRFPTRMRYWISHDVKGRPDARYCCRSVKEQAQIRHDPMKALFHSHKRCSHTADAADEHIYVWATCTESQRRKGLCNVATDPGSFDAFHTA